MPVEPIYHSPVLLGSARGQPWEHGASSRKRCWTTRQEAAALSVRFILSQVKFKSSRLQLGSRCVSQAVPDPSPGACLSPACFPQTSPLWKVLLQVSSSPFPSLPL